MAREETCVLTNMCMVYDGDRILVQNRRNPDWPGIVFPGGHVESGESFVDSVIREIKEETGLDISNVELCGVKQFTYKNGTVRYIVFLYRTHTYTGELKDSEEGEVFWINKDQLSEYTAAEGFEEMYEVFVREDLTENFHWIENGEWYSKNK